MPRGSDPVTSARTWLSAAVLPFARDVLGKRTALVKTREPDPRLSFYSDSGSRTRRDTQRQFFFGRAPKPPRTRGRSSTGMKTEPL